MPEGSAFPDRSTNQEALYAFYGHTAQPDSQTEIASLPLDEARL